MLIQHRARLIEPQGRTVTTMAFVMEAMVRVKESKRISAKTVLTTTAIMMEV